VIIGHEWLPQAYGLSALLALNLASRQVGKEARSIFVKEYLPHVTWHFREPQSLLEFIRLCERIVSSENGPWFKLWAFHQSSLDPLDWAPPTALHRVARFTIEYLDQQFSWADPTPRQTEREAFLTVWPIGQVNGSEHPLRILTYKRIESPETPVDEQGAACIRSPTAPAPPGMTRTLYSSAETLQGRIRDLRWQKYDEELGVEMRQKLRQACTPKTDASGIFNGTSPQGARHSNALVEAAPGMLARKQQSTRHEGTR